MASFWPASRPDPLGDYLDALERTIALAPEIAYGGHGDTVVVGGYDETTSLLRLGALDARTGRPTEWNPRMDGQPRSRSSATGSASSPTY